MLSWMNCWDSGLVISTQSKSDETSRQQEAKSWRYMFSQCAIPFWWAIHQLLVTVLSIISPKTWYTWKNLRKKSSSFYTIKAISQNTFNLNLSQLLLWMLHGRKALISWARPFWFIKVNAITLNPTQETLGIAAVCGTLLLNVPCLW